MSNLILGTAFNYSFDKISLFLKSLTGIFDGTVIIFTDNIFRPEPTLSFKVQFEYINTQSIKTDLPVPLTHINNYRFFLFRSFLKTHPQFKRILISDIRDVVFQKNPFNFIDNGRVLVSLEDNTIGNCSYNSSWIKLVFGQTYLDSISCNRIICAGTTIGSYGAISNYLDGMEKLLIKYGPLHDNDITQINIDQGLHNHWCYSNIEKITFNENANDSTFTMGYSNTFNFNRDGQLINKKNEPYSILHQYDRFPFLASMLESKFRKIILNNEKVSFFNRIYVRVKEGLNH